MIATTSGSPATTAAGRLFELATQLYLATLPGRRRAGDLKDMEHLALAVLAERSTMIVGEIQRQLGVLPAQMSRLIRSLESRERPLITCCINPRDKRKIDVAITGAGRKALEDYQAGRVHRISLWLRHLGEDERVQLARALEKMAASLDDEPRV